MAHTSEHLAVLVKLSDNTRAKKGGGGASNLLEQLKRYFCVGILFESTPRVRAQTNFYLTFWDKLSGRSFCGNRHPDFRVFPSLGRASDRANSTWE